METPISLLDVGADAPLTDEDVTVLNTVLSMPADVELIQAMPVKIMVGRLKLGGTKVENRAILFLSSFCSTPAHAVIFAWTLNRYAKRVEGTITLESLLLNVFRLSMPTEEQMHAVWMAQKKNGAPCCNALDEVEIWRS